MTVEGIAVLVIVGGAMFAVGILGYLIGHQNGIADAAAAHREVQEAKRKK